MSDFSEKSDIFFSPNWGNPRTPGKRMTITVPRPMMTSMGILTWMIVGLTAGLSVNVLMKRPNRDVLADLLLGATGAIAGGLVASQILGISDPIDGLNIVAILVSCAGAVVLVAFVEALSSRRVAA